MRVYRKLRPKAEDIRFTERINSIVIIVGERGRNWVGTRCPLLMRLNVDSV